MGKLGRHWVEIYFVGVMLETLGSSMFGVLQESGENTLKCRVLVRGELSA